MTVLRLALLISLVALSVKGQQNSPQQPLIPPTSCPVTVPSANPFKPPKPYEVGGRNSFVVGTEKLWTTLRKSGVWSWGPHKAGHENEVQPLTEKIFWVSRDFDWREEYPPEIRVTGRRLDVSAPPLLTMTPTNAFPGPAAAMLVGVYVPTPGCWEITGDYKGEKLSFVVWVQSFKQ